MAWQDETVPLLRTIINDSLSPTTYSDSRLEEVLLHSAYIINTKIDFDNNYAVTISTKTIVPDPVSSSDDSFVYLMSVQAAVIIFRSEAKTSASESFRITDGPSSIDCTTGYQAKKQLANDMEKDLASAILQFRAGNSIAGKAILSPYTQEGLSNEGRTFF